MVTSTLFQSNGTIFGYPSSPLQYIYKDTSSIKRRKALIHIVTNRHTWLIRRVLDLMIGFIDSLYTQLGTTGKQRAIAHLHTLHFTVTHELGFSAFTSRILATDLSISLSFQITHKVSFQEPVSLLSISSHTLDCHLQNSTQFSTTELSQLLETNCSLGTYRYIAPRRGPHGKHRLLLSHVFSGVVYWSVA
jgi:hypothetical protein